MISAMQKTSYRNINFGSERNAHRQSGMGKIKEKFDPDVTATDVGVGAVAAAAVPTATGVLKNANEGLKVATKISNQGSAIVEAIPKNKATFKNLFMNLGKFAEESKILAPLAKIAKTKPFQRIAGIFGGSIAIAFTVADMGNIVNTSADLATSYVASNQNNRYNRYNRYDRCDSYGRY